MRIAPVCAAVYIPSVSPIDLLRQIPVFTELSDVALARLAERCIERTVAEGVLLFSAGEPSRGLYIVASGRVKVYRLSSDGREQTLHLEGPGRTVAELPLFDGGVYPASAITLEPSRLVFLPRADFEAVYMGSPEIARVIIHALGKRLRHLVQVADTLAFRDVAARLALLLAGYADRGGRTTEAGTEISLERTQEELALEIGTARESVSRAMRQLRQKGYVIAVNRTTLVIPNVARLRTLAGPGSRAPK